MFGIWQRAELAKRIDVLAGFLGSRRAGDPELRTEATAAAEEAHAALAAGDLRRAREGLHELEGLAVDWRDHPHFPAEPRPAEADEQVRDYVKDRLRGVVSRDELDRLDRPYLSLVVTRRRLCARPDLDRRTREDVQYVYARGRMALDLGHPEAAAREARRLEAIEARLADADG